MTPKDADAHFNKKLKQPNKYIAEPLHRGISIK